MIPLTDESKEKLANMDTEAKGLHEDLADALDDMGDAVSDLLRALERMESMDLPSSGWLTH